METIIALEKLGINPKQNIKDIAFSNGKAGGVRERHTLDQIRILFYAAALER
ncbi:hypothetical protein M2146_001114 [Lachnospiraceae bacterium PF1-22]